MNNADMPAMPVSGFEQDNGRISGQLHHGLTKREYFAGLALQGLCSDPNMRDFETEAATAVGMADALLAELERTK